MGHSYNEIWDVKCKLFDDESGQCTGEKPEGCHSDTCCGQCTYSKDWCSNKRDFSYCKEHIR